MGEGGGGGGLRLGGLIALKKMCFCSSPNFSLFTFHIKTKSQNKRPGRTLYYAVNRPLYCTVLYMQCTYQKMREKKLFLGYQFVDFGYQFVGYQ